MNGLDAFSGALITAVLGVHVAVGVALTVWSARIASRRGGAYRLAVALAPIGAVAPLIGGCLTIHGMIDAFGAVAHAEASTRSSVLSQGISDAMTATAVALGVAVVSYLASAVTSAVGARRATERAGEAPPG